MEDQAPNFGVSANDPSYSLHSFPQADSILIQLKRIADAQEGMLAIAAEARIERLKLSDERKRRFQAGFQSGEKV